MPKHVRRQSYKKEFKGDKKISNALLMGIKETTGATVRELSRHFGIRKDVVFKT